MSRNCCSPWRVTPNSISTSTRHPGRGNAERDEQTLPQLLTRLAKQVDMRWELDGPNLTVMPDSPFLRVYKVDYVNMERTSTGTVGVSAQISGTATSGGGAGAGASANTSSTTLRNQSSNKFWETLVENVKDILRETDKVLPAGARRSPPRPSLPRPRRAGRQASREPRHRARHRPSRTRISAKRHR